MANSIVQQINVELDTLQKELNQFKSTIEYLNEAKDNVNVAVRTVNETKAFYGQKIDELKSTYNSFISLIDTVNAVVAKIETINFPERLDNIEKSVNQTVISLNETRTATIDELQRASKVITNSDFEGKFNKLQTVVSDSILSNNILGESIEKQKLPEKIDAFEKNIKTRLETSITDLQNNTKLISDHAVKTIQDLNLPIRLDKVDANIAGMMAAIQNLQTRLESLERNLIEKFNYVSERQFDKLEIVQTNINQGLMGLKDQNKSARKKQNIYAYITWIIIIAAVSISIYIFKI